MKARGVLPASLPIGRMTLMEMAAQKLIFTGPIRIVNKIIVLVFNSGGNGQVRQGCNASWQNISWRLLNNSRTLNISLPGDELNLALSQFDANTIRGTDPVYLDGNTFNVTYTFQRR